MVARYFLLISAFLLFNPPVVLSVHSNGNVEVYRSGDSGSNENVQFSKLRQVEQECKWSTLCTGPTYSCTPNCAESSNMQPSGSWVPAVPTQTSGSGCGGYYRSKKCLCCKK